MSLRNSEPSRASSPLAVVALAALSLCCHLGSPRPVSAGLLYALQSTTSGNQIWGRFVNDLTGEVLPLPGFPVPTGGAGDGLLHYQYLAYDPENARLYAYNLFSGTISAFAVDLGSGAVQPLPHSPFAAPAAGTAGDCLSVHPGGSPLLLSFHSIDGSGIESFVVDGSSAVAAAGSPFTAAAAGLNACRFTPDGAFVYIGGGAAGYSIVEGWAVDAGTGVLTTVPGSPFDTGAPSPVSYALDDTRLFLANQSANQVQVFVRDAAGSLAAATGSPFASAQSNHHLGVLHPAGFYLVANGTGNQVGAFEVAGAGSSTTLVPVPGSPFAAPNFAPSLLALQSAGDYLFVGRVTGRTLATFAVDPATGVLALSPTQPAGSLGSGGTLNGLFYIEGGCHLTCPPSLDVANDPGQCGATAALPAPAALGACGNVACSPGNGDFLPIGATTITCATEAGPSCSFAVTVTDLEPPVLAACPADLFLDLPPGASGAPIDYPEPGAADNCPGVSTACQPASGDFFTVGATTVVCAASDVAGSGDECAFDVVLGSQTIQEIPAASTLGLAVLAFLLAGIALIALRRTV